MRGDDEMKHIKEYQEVMRNLYKEAMKYPDDKLAKAIADVRDLIVEYKNIIDSYETNKKQLKIYLVWFGNDDMEDMLVGVADTREQAERMKEKLESIFEDAYEYHIQPWITNQVTIDDIQYRY